MGGVIQPTELVDLSDDIWIEILTQLATFQPIKPAIADLLSIGIVSSKFNVFSTKLIRKYFFDFKTQTNSLLLKFPETESIRVPSNGALSIQTICSLPNLTEIDLTELDFLELEDFPFIEPTSNCPFIFQSFQKLRSLKTKHFPSSFTEDNITLLSNLTHLQGMFPDEVKHLTQLLSISFLKDWSDSTQYNSLLPSLLQLRKLKVTIYSPYPNKSSTFLTNLTDLELHGHNTKDKQMKHFSLLTRLSIGSDRLTSKFFDFLPNLTAFEWSGNRVDLSKGILKVKKLNSLILHNEVIDKVALYQLISLTEFGRYGMLGLSNQVIGRLTNLTSLVNITPQRDVEEIYSLIKLKKLEMDTAFQLPKEFFYHFTNLTSWDGPKDCVYEVLPWLKEPLPSKVLNIKEYQLKWGNLKER